VPVYQRSNCFAALRLVLKRGNALLKFSNAHHGADDRGEGYLNVVGFLQVEAHTQGERGEPTRDARIATSSSLFFCFVMPVILRHPMSRRSARSRCLHARVRRRCCVRRATLGFNDPNLAGRQNFISALHSVRRARRLPPSLDVAGRSFDGRPAICLGDFHGQTLGA
jgi:hypothetical protein